MASIDIAGRLRELVANAPAEVTAIYLFGSLGRQTASATSDIDVGVLLVAAPPHTLEGRLMDYRDLLEEALGRRIDLVILNDAAPDLVHRVLRDGRILLDRDRAARIRFEVRARNLYFDLQPMLRTYRRRVLARAHR